MIIQKMKVASCNFSTEFSVLCEKYAGWKLELFGWEELTTVGQPGTKGASRGLSN